VVIFSYNLQKNYLQHFAASRSRAKKVSDDDLLVDYQIFKKSLTVNEMEVVPPQLISNWLSILVSDLVELLYVW
jgi:hypothetical protein